VASTIKQRVHEVIGAVSDDATWQELLCGLELRFDVEAGLADAGAGSERWQPLLRTYGGLRQVTRKRITNVWDATEDTPEKAENMRLRSSLMIALKAHLVGSGLTQRQIAKHFGVTQPRVSDLMHGKIDEFGLDALVNMAAAAGLRVKLTVRKAA
jgi:predicted XRE-type DNA-binding protein